MTTFLEGFDSGQIAFTPAIGDHIHYYIVIVKSLGIVCMPISGGSAAGLKLSVSSSVKKAVWHFLLLDGKS